MLCVEILLAVIKPVLNVPNTFKFPASDSIEPIIKLQIYAYVVEIL